MKNISKSIVFLLFVTGSCSSVTRLDSDDFKTVEERVKILKQEIRCFSEIRDAEFELFNVNGFKSQSQGLTIPGSSSWDYKFVIKVDTAEIGKWTEGMVKFDPEYYDNNWIKEITKQRAENWTTTCEPTYYMRPEENVSVVQFRDNGIIFKRVIAN